MPGTVISLCDRTGNMVKPWIEAGYEAVTVDLQEAEPMNGRSHVVMDVRECVPRPPYVAVFAFPPCTHLAVSGSRWMRTCLWVGNGFVMPKPKPAVELWMTPPDDRIHKMPPSEDRADLRSATPMGFARAVFEANAPHLKAEAA